MTIYLLGVSHDQQEDASPEFTKYMRASCVSYDIRSVGEELSCDGLHDIGKSSSSVKRLADELRLPHKYCGPTRTERQQAGIVGLQEIEQLAWFHGWSESKVKEARASYFKKIENAWLERLKPMFVNPMLFVCGAAHLDSFPMRARNHNFTAIRLDRTFVTTEEEFWAKKKANKDLNLIEKSADFSKG